MTINRRGRAQVGCTKIIDILSEWTRSIIKGEKSYVGCSKITDTL
jgi:hypothetical protein